MKRSQTIHLTRLRKAERSFPVKPVVLGIAAASIVGCGNSNEAYIYKSLDECFTAYPSKWQQCNNAYQQALARSRRDGKKFNDRDDCELEYGQQSCEYNAGVYIPAMTGFMFSPYYSRGYSPVYSSNYRHSPYYGRWGTLDGDYYPRSINTASSSVKPKRKVTMTKKTISRGGFGSSVSAKSSWGGSSSRGGWGG